MYDYINELLKEYQTTLFFLIYAVFLYYFLYRIGYQFDKITEKKERLKDSYGDAIENLDKSTVIKSNEEYYQRKRDKIEDYHRSLTRLNDDFRSEQLYYISQGIIVICSLLIVLIVVNLPL